MELPPHQPILNHLRTAIRNGASVIAASYLVGLIGGLALSQWADTRVGSVGGFFMSAAMAGYLTWAYYKTRGLLHYSGFGKWRSGEN